MSYVRAASFISILTILSNILGFFREIFIAKTFGISSDIDCFIVGYTLIFFIFLIFNPSAIQTIFMPHYQSLLNQNKVHDAVGLFNTAFVLLGSVLLIFCVLLFFCSPLYVPILSPGFDQRQVLLTCQVIQILTPLAFLLGISSLFYALCNAHQNFMPHLISQIANNLMVILLLSVMVISSVLELSVIFVISGFVSFGMIVKGASSYMKRAYHLSCKENFSKLIAISYPLLGLILMDQVAIILQKMIASELGTGSIASLNYAAKLAGFPVGIFAVAISTVLFPIFINQTNLQEDNPQKIVAYFEQGIRLILYTLLPASLFFMLKSEGIVTLLFSSKNFDANAIAKTSSALFYYGLGLIFQGFLVYLNRVYFACNASRMFVRLGLLSVLIHVFLCCGLSKFMGADGIALGTSLYAFMNVLLLMIYLRKVSPIFLNYRIFLRPISYTSICFIAFYLFPNDNGSLGILKDGIIIAIGFFLPAWLTRDQYMKEILQYFKK